MNEITQTRVSTAVQPSSSYWCCCSDLLNKIKQYICTFFRYLFCCRQQLPPTQAEMILQRIGLDPDRGNGYLAQINSSVKETYESKFLHKTASPLMGFVNNVPGEYDFWMGGVALVIAHLKKKYQFEHFYACETLKAFSLQLAAFAYDRSSEHAVFIVACFSSGRNLEERCFRPDFPQHKVAVVVQKEPSGIIKLAIMEVQADEQTFISQEKIEGHDEIWEGWNKRNQFGNEEVILRAVVKAGLPESTELFYSVVRRERSYGCAQYALQSAIAFLRDRRLFFDRIVVSKTTTRINGMRVSRIIELPASWMIGTQSLKQLDAYKQGHPNAFVKRKGKIDKTLDNYYKKYVVGGRNHYITVKIVRYYQIVLRMLARFSSAEIDQILSETLVRENSCKVIALKNRPWLFKGSQRDCQGAVSTDQVRALCLNLNAHSPVGIQFNLSKVIPTIQDGTCSAMSLEFMDSYFKARKITIEGPEGRLERLLDHLVKLGQSFSSSSQERMNLQAAYNTIEVQLDNPLSGSIDYSKNKVQSLANHYSLVIDYSSSEMDVNKLDHESEVSQELDALPEGAFFLRIIKPVTNERLEEWGHSLVYIKEHGLNLFYDPNYGVRNLPFLERATLLSQSLKQPVQSFQLRKMRFYRLQPALVV